LSCYGKGMYKGDGVHNVKIILSDLVRAEDNFKGYFYIPRLV